MVAYMKNKAREVKVFTAPFSIAITLTALVVVGTYYEVPPMSTIIAISESFKDSAEQKYGNPPYGQAQLSSLNTLAKKEGVNLEAGIASLKAAGIKVEGGGDIVKNIAKRNNKSPQQIWEIFRKAGKSSSAEIKSNMPEADVSHSGVFPERQQAGWGKQTISNICASYNLDEAKLIALLKLEGMDVTADQKVKEIAETYGTDPSSFFGTLKKLAPLAKK